MAGLLVAHLILVFYHKHTQFPGAGKTEKNVVGMPLLPIYTAKAGGFFFLVFGVIAAIAAIATINPIWAMGPYRPDQVSTGAQPDWYMGFSEGLIRVMPGWEIRAWGHTLVLGVFIPLMIFPLVLVAIAVYPFIESWVTGDKREHHLLDRPRNRPVRTGFGVAWLTLYFMLLIGGGNDICRHALPPVDQRDHLVRPDRLLRAAGRSRSASPSGSAWACSGATGTRCCTVARPASSSGCRTASSSRCTSRSSQQQLHMLTAHAQPQPVDDRPRGRRERRRAQGRTRSRSCRRSCPASFYGEHSQIPKPTVEEYEEITSGHGHH